MSEYAKTTRVYDQHSAAVVETVTIDGVAVDIVAHVIVSADTDGGEITVRRGDELSVGHEALRAGTYKLHHSEQHFYANTGQYHKAGDRAGGRQSYASAINGNRNAANSLGVSRTAKGAITAARRALKAEAAYAKYAKVAETNIRTLTLDEWRALDADAAIAVGDLVVISSHGKYRVGVATHATTKVVKALVATPSGRVAQGASGKTGTSARLWRKAEATGTEAAAEVASETAETTEQTAHEVTAGETNYVVADDQAADDAALTTAAGAELPAAVATIARQAAEFIGTTADDLFIADHTHEELSEGAYSIAFEGDYDWPFRFTEAVFAGRYAKPGGWLLEAGTGWYLAVYPDRDAAERARDTNRPALDIEQERRAVAGRIFASMQGLDAPTGCTRYRMVTARVGRRVLEVYRDAGDLLGTLAEVGGVWHPTVRLPNGRDMSGCSRGTFPEAVREIEALRLTAERQEFAEALAATPGTAEHPVTYRELSPAETRRILDDAAASAPRLLEASKRAGSAQAGKVAAEMKRQADELRKVDERIRSWDDDEDTADVPLDVKRWAVRIQDADRDSFPPTHPYAGANSDRQAVGDPGHCWVCAIVGHVTAHPELGCGDVRCASPHDQTAVAYAEEVALAARVRVLKAEQANVKPVAVGVEVDPQVRALLGQILGELADAVEAVTPAGRPVVEAAILRYVG